MENSEVKIIKLTKDDVFSSFGGDVTHGKKGKLYEVRDSHADEMVERGVAVHIAERDMKKALEKEAEKAEAEKAEAEAEGAKSKKQK